MHTRRTLLLTEKWDLALDGAGRIALAGEDLATAQNVANEARLFTRDAYFTQDRGVPHFLVELGRRLNGAVLRSYLRRAALLVPDVKEALSVEILGFDPERRKLSGEIQFTTVEGVSNGMVRTDF
jgi:hypothetical protein